MRWWEDWMFYLRWRGGYKGSKLYRLYRIVRWLQGARKAKLGPTAGVFECPGTRIEFEGMCPVQGWGEIDGLPCYYRARGEVWSFDVTLGDGSRWYYSERKYFKPEGGYLDASVSYRNIERAVQRFKRERRQ